MLTRRAFLQSVAAAGAAAPFVSCAAEQAGAAPLDIADEPQLFLDDWIIDRATNLTRTLHQPKKHGLIKNAPDGTDWDRGDVYHGNIVCRDAAGRFHMTYRYMWDDPGVAKVHPYIANDKAHWYRESVAYATSTDGVYWTKPDLGLVDGPTGFQKRTDYPFNVASGTSKHNNLGCPFDFIYDLHAHGNLREKDKRFLLRVARRDDTHPFAKVVESRLCYAADWPDFANDPDWQKKLIPLEGADISPRGFRTIAGFDHAAKEWFAASQDTLGNWMPRGGRDIAKFSSPDLANWNGPTLVLPVAADESKRLDDYVEYMDLMAYRVGGERSGVWLGQLTVFHGDRTSRQYQMPDRPEVWRKGITELRLVVSRDAGKTWRRVCDKQVWLPRHPEPHGYDRLVFSSMPLRVEGEMWMYYSAWDGDHLIFNRDGSLFEPGFARTGRTARATFRRDGYVSLDAGRNPGELLTKPLNFNGSELCVNVGGRGSLRAELQDAAGRPVVGFAFADCTPIEADHRSASIKWRGGRLPDPGRQGSRLRIRLTDASLYSFQFSDV